MRSSSVPARVGTAVLLVAVVVLALSGSDPLVSAMSTDEVLFSEEELPVGFSAVSGPVDPTNLCGTKFADMAPGSPPRAITGRLFLASPQDGTTASLEEEVLSFGPGDGARFAARLVSDPSCPLGWYVRPDGMAVHGTVKPLVLQGLDGEVSSLQLCGRGSGRRLRHHDSRIDQVVIRHGDHIGILTYASYGFFFDEGVRNRLAHQFAARLAALQ